MTSRSSGAALRTASPVDELVICLLARMLRDAGTVACGTASPVPAAAALLAQRLFPGKTKALIFGDPVSEPFHESGSELYDRIAQGRVNVFFASGAQIDGQANLNNVGIGPYPRTHLRFPGSFGTPFVALMVPRVIIYRAEHTLRTLVERVDFISAPGVPPVGVHRRGGPTDLVTHKAAFKFNPMQGGFALLSVHPGYSVADIVASTGFRFEVSTTVQETEPPEEHALALLRGPVHAELAQAYPQFAATRLGGAQ